MRMSLWIQRLRLKKLNLYKVCDNMIREKIIVEYYENRETNEITLNYDYTQDYYTYKREYNVFKNNGKVSKTDMSKYDFVNREAERLLTERLKLKSETGEDEKKVMELAKIVRKAYEDMINKDPESKYMIEWDYIKEDMRFDDSLTPGWVTIKIKMSHSKWYDSDEGFGHAPSTYYYQVPACVEKEANELQKIRRKHQNDNTFNFWITDYPKRVVREADH